MKEIKLSAGKVTIVDDEDYALLSKYKWTYNPSGTGYAYTTKRQNGNKIQHILMHRFLMKPEKGKIVDHKNGNGLDNRRENLRVCSQTENHRNQRPQVKEGKYSKYKGVSWDKHRRKWITYITLPYRKFKCLGRYENEVDAAKAYNKAAINFFGEFARLNEVVSQLVDG